MKRFLILAAIILGILGLTVGLVALRLQADRPEALIARLASTRGAAHQEAVLRLSLARGDVATKLIAAWNRSASPAFRAEALELLLKRNLREPDERITALVRQALTNSVVEVRRAAARGLVTYGDAKQQTALADCVGDTDDVVRRQAYACFASGGGWAPGSFPVLTPAARSNLVAACAAQMKTESDSDLAFLARAVVGREITERCDAGMKALGAGEVAKAKDLIAGALALDPQNQQAQIRMARLYLTTGEPQTAVATARKYGALIEIPRLSQAPVIDGDPSDAVWKEAFAADTFYQTTSPYAAQRTKGKSKCYCGYRDGRVYVAMLGYEDDLDKLVVKHKNRDEGVFYDDCVELIFNPENTDNDFMQFIINPAGTLMDIKNKDEKVNFPCEYKAGVFKERGYWAVEFAIDAKALTAHPITSETIWSLDFFRTRIGGGSEQCGIWPPYGFSLHPALYPLAIFKDAPAP